MNDSLPKIDSPVAPDSDKIGISVIVPVYGVEKYIRKSAESLFSQTLREGIEFIFVDDCSPDSSIDILREVLEMYPERKSQVRILRHEKNKGLAGARMTGIEAARGEYVIHCDSDDWVDEDMYASMLAVARKEKADIVVCDYVSEYPRKSVAYSGNPGTTPRQMLSEMLAGRQHCSVWNKLIRRDLYRNLSPAWEEGVNMWEDVMVICRLVYFAHKVAYVPHAMYHYNQQMPSAYTRSRRPEIPGQIYRAWNAVDSFIAGRPDGMSYSNELDAFRGRALYSVLTRAQREEREGWILKFKEGAIHWPPVASGFGRKDRMILSLLLNRHNRLADLILNTQERLKKILRG